ncbi:hypothetical protein DFP72DRAFT_903503 [Ephemerocybe angulata]|uniref:F-box domain-containing protein n=1 Tax=Ephemerocybe angulata TaxID=980116 RepID=A0A8H6HTX3_9AGAR|nr:hypothetical protein DFP72DRAFT_903503 [Tulosesus angulatus]
MARLPTELLDTIIDELQNCKQALLPFSLVSKGCRARARLHLFRKLHLGNRREADETLSCPSRQIQRLQSAHELLAADDTLGWCVQSLTVTLTTFFLSLESEGTQTEEADAFNRLFPQILGRLPRLAHLCMGPDKSRLSITDWNQLPADTQKALKCCISTNLKGLELKSMINVPLQSILSLGSSLESLMLWDVSLYSSADSRQKLQDMGLRSVKTLGWNGRPAEPQSVLTSPLKFPLTGLEILVLIIKSEQDLHDLKTLSESCSETLRVMSLAIRFRLHLLLLHHSRPTLLFDVASALPQLSRLALSLSLPSLPGQKYLIPLKAYLWLAAL